ncbi:O-methyltransferase [Nocardia transvalensis]|uniref:O-methyltransferase n=1 Tax=Nocardia transvalensis TaxID=37333 RepID=UPI001894EB77|nr:class I SAM-dependent methyltransferase [Nocardia transvalensis]MBF6330309.1 class I SAM-dependent methyltransferase [Nocardia transvalensis]
MADDSHRPLRDPAVNTVIEKLAAAQQFPVDDPRIGQERDPHDYSEWGFSISPDQGDLIYLLCRGIGATRTVEFATSVGMSTLYAAAAVRDNGGGTVIGSEIVPAKIAAARRNLADAGLADYVDIRAGDARATLRDLGGPVDFALIDGWVGVEPSLAREVIEIIAPQLRIGAYVMNDNAEPDFLAYIRDPANGFLSVTLPLHGGTELCVKVADR